jgi:hypothetical protein
MSLAFKPLGTNYLLSLADDSSLFTLTIADNNAVGVTWQVSNLDSANVAYVHISTDSTDGGAFVPTAGVPGQGTAILPKQSVFVTVNVTGIATGNVFVSGAVTGTADVIFVPGLMV